MEVDDLFDVGQSETEALDIVLVTGMYTVELIEDLAEVLFLDALTGVANGEVELVGIVPGMDVDVEGFVLLAVLHSIVHQVGDGILEMHLVDIDSGVNGFYLGVYLASRMLHTQGEGLGYLLHHLVEVELLLLEDDALLVEHRHLEDFLHEEAQAFRLVGNDTTEVFGHLLGLRDGVVVHHLDSQRDGGYRGLQLVCHIVDEVVLDLGIPLLTEDDDDSENKRDEQHDGEDDAGNHEAHTGEDVGVHLGEVDANDTTLRLRVVAEKHLLVGIFLAFVGIVRTTVDLTTISGRDGQMIGNIDAVVDELGTDVLIEHTEIDTLLQGFVAGCI